MDPDQPAHPRSLIRIHVVRYQFLYLLKVLIEEEEFLFCTTALKRAIDKTSIYTYTKTKKKRKKKKAKNKAVRDTRLQTLYQHEFVVHFHSFTRIFYK
jgi:hypothetical protein